MYVEKAFNRAVEELSLLPSSHRGKLKFHFVPLLETFRRRISLILHLGTRAMLATQCIVELVSSSLSFLSGCGFFGWVFEGSLFVGLFCFVFLILCLYFLKASGSSSR